MAKAKFSINSSLSDQSKTAAQLKREAYHYEVVSLLDIIPSRHNFYSMDADSIIELAEDICENGLLNPPLLQKANANGKYPLVDGERRYRALMQLYEGGCEEYLLVLCQIKDVVSETQAEMLTISANMYTRILTEADKLEQANRIQEICAKLKKDGKITKGRTRDYAARMLQVSSAQIGIYNKINKSLSEDLKPLIKSGEMSITQANVISSLPTDNQKEIADKVSRNDTDAIKQAVETVAVEKKDSRRKGLIFRLRAIIDEIERGEMPDTEIIMKACADAIKSLEMMPKKL